MVTSCPSCVDLAPTYLSFSLKFHLYAHIHNDRNDSSDWIDHSSSKDSLECLLHLLNNEGMP